MTKTRLQEKYEKEIVKILEKEFDIKNVHGVPKLSKVVVNFGVGALSKNQAGIDTLKKDVAQITGQMPSIRLSKVSIASFNLREGMPVGISCTLRGEKMYSFIDRLFSVVLPRLRDFRGISRGAFDKNGNYTIGLSEHTVFPEIDITKSAPSHGMEISLVINQGSYEKSERLLELLGCPFTKK